MVTAGPFEKFKGVFSEAVILEPLRVARVYVEDDYSGAKSRMICCSTFGSTTRVSPLSGSFSE